MYTSSRCKAKHQDYDGFVGKFKVKRTTDDCYTPDAIYSAVCDWAVRRYDLDDCNIVRPFWPGEDYQARDYASDDVVIDNPPFSQITPIVRWYQARDIRFLLFCPGMTLVMVKGVTYVITDSTITYANGATVPTGFVTNLSPDLIIEVAPDLRDALARVQPSEARTLPKYELPPNVMTAAKLKGLARLGVPLKVPAADGIPITALDAQKKASKKLYGGGVLISDRAARMAQERSDEAREAIRAARAAEGKADAVWTLSDREKQIIASMEMAD